MIEKDHQLVTEAERCLPTSQLLQLLRDAMTAPLSNGYTLEEEAKAIQRQQEWMAGAEEREVQVLELFANQAFALMAKLLEKKNTLHLNFTDRSLENNQHKIKLTRDNGGLRAIFSYGQKYIDLSIYRDVENKIYIKQHLGGTLGTRRLPIGAKIYKNNFDFAGPNLTYLREELEALSDALDTLDDFNTDLS